MKPFPWPDNRKAAISLTYDDCLPCHRNDVAPLLAQHGLRATFYMPAAVEDLHEHVAKWRGVASMGHELGNHSCFHPCRNADGARAWLDPSLDLSTYSVARWEAEIALANRVLTLVDGALSRSYGNTCHDESVGRGADEVSLRTVMRQHVSAARGPHTGAAADPWVCDLAGIGCVSGDARTADDLIAEAEGAMHEGRWLIWCVHGVGEGSHKLWIDSDEHRRLIEWLSGARDRLVVAGVHEVATHVERVRGGV